MDEFRQLRADIREEIGMDAYSRYTHERYAITELVLRLLEEVVIMEFIRGFFDFETLGRNVRERVQSFSSDFLRDPKLVSLDISKDVNVALRTAPYPDAAKVDAGHKRLVSFLVGYGMHEEIAEAHATIIESSILSSMRKSQ